MDLRTVRRLGEKHRLSIQEGLITGAAGCLNSDEWPDHLEAACDLIIGAKGAEVKEAVNAALQQIGTKFTKAKQFMNWQNQITAIING